VTSEHFAEGKHNATNRGRHNQIAIPLLFVKFTHSCRTHRVAQSYGDAPERAKAGSVLAFLCPAELRYQVGAVRGRAVALSRFAMHAHPEVSANGDKLRALVHELRNAVAPIINAAHLMRRRVGADPESSNLLAVIERHMSEIVGTIDAIADSGNASVESSPELESVSGPEKRRILVADDNRDLRLSFAAILRDSGHEVRLAADGTEALQLAEQWQPEFVVLDVHMPGIDGYEIARRLRAQFPPTAMRLVMMSGTGLDQATLVGARNAGFDHCIDKLAAVASLDELLRADAQSMHAASPSRQS
jgi:CheY-like chemotaxis protein